MLMAYAEVDLHILVVPENQWRPDLRLAYSNTCMTSVSAGFVRVDPDVTLDALRGEISRQLDSTALPQSYVFLRSVGRYLCTVSRNQELSLTSKLFVPPLAACPEIYLLNATSLTEERHGPPSLTSSLAASLPPLHYSPIISSQLHYSPHTSSQLHCSPHTSSQLHCSPHTSSQLHCSPHTSSQLHCSPHTSSPHTSSQQISNPLDSTPTTTHPPSHVPHHDHKHSPTSLIDTRRSLLHLSDKSKKFSKGRFEGDKLKFALPNATQEQQEQSHVTNRLSYQPRDDSEVNSSQTQNRSNAITAGKESQSSQCNENIHSQQAGQGEKLHVKSKTVHFESLTHLPEKDNSLAGSLSKDTVHKRRDEVVLSPSNQIQTLMGQIRRVKDESKHLSVVKDNLYSTIRQLQHKLKARKEKDDSEWKVKLANEKKQTKTLERSIRKLNAELEAVNNRVGNLKKHTIKKSAASTDQHKVSKSVAKSESNHTNVKLECKRADADMEKLRKTLDEEKQKLKAEQERHHSIVEECKVLKKELVQLKMAHNRERKR